MDNLKDKISLLIYTSKNYVPISKLCVDEFNNYAKQLTCDKFVVSNEFNNNEHLFNNTGFNLISANVEYSEESRHYTKTLMQGLKQLKTKYVLLWYDDYLLINELKVSNLNKLINIIESNNIDHFSFMSYSYEWEKLNINYNDYGLPDNLINKIDNSYFYRFSIQPTIWRIDKLMELLSFNLNISLHEMDCSIIHNKKGKSRYNTNHIDNFWNDDDDFWDINIQSFCFSKNELVNNYAFDEGDKDSDYLFFKYSEVIRGGKFNFHTHNNNRKYIENYLIDKVKDNKLYKEFL